VRATARIRFALALLVVLAMACWASPGARASAAADPGWMFREAPLVQAPGDQLSPAIDGGFVFFRDMSVSGGALARHELATGANTLLFGSGIAAGPAANAGAVAWQNTALDACLGTAAGDASRCLALPAATQLALAGTRAVTAHSNNIIRLVNFETMRSKILDSSTTSGGRYDPDVEGDRAVWVKERGYAGKYYEPLIVSYDLLTDTLTYETKLGGGETSAGESVYERRHPVLSDGRIMYQQRLRDVSGWDIFEAVPDTFGQPVAAPPGDQVNPSVDGRFLVYQDNRGAAQSSSTGGGEWDIYLTDLITGEELAVCTAAGDQVNPVVRGNLIVWEDNRGGDWDLYSATITQFVAPAMEPKLTLAATSAIWETFAQYIAGDITVRFTISNPGLGPARDVTLRQIAAWPMSVSQAGPLPPLVSLIDPGKRAVLPVRFHLQPGARHFRLWVTASCLDADGRELWFPRPLPG